MAQAEETSVRPRIGITSGLGSDSWRAHGVSWRPYADAVERAGGVPVRLDARTLGREGAVLAELQGVLFTGGKDIDLAMYPNPPDLRGENPAIVMERCRMRPEPDRDAYEIPLLREAVERDLPVLGVCRGCQVLNVALGGRLVLDIEIELHTPVHPHIHTPTHTSRPAPDGASSHHRLQVDPGSFLATILHPERYTACNSRHHQAVRVDDALPVRVAAVSPEDGVVEAVEVPGRRWAVGVQWHPEHPGDPQVPERYEPLFRAFIEAAS
jgi:gamma-glutamyl-gamma-aminobutyrate hydrolase PuuD